MKRKSNKNVDYKPHIWLFKVEFRVNTWDADFTLRVRDYQTEEKAKQKVADYKRMKQLFEQAGSQRIGKFWVEKQYL